MQKWEYRTLTVYFISPGGPRRELENGCLENVKRLGEEGWELVAVALDGRQHALYFKRPKSDSQ